MTALSRKLLFLNDEPTTDQAFPKLKAPTRCKSSAVCSPHRATHPDTSRQSRAKPGCSMEYSARGNRHWHQDNDAR
jgi:hypothetical protein